MDVLGVEVAVVPDVVGALGDVLEDVVVGALEGVQDARIVLHVIQHVVLDVKVVQETVQDVRVVLVALTVHHVTPLAVTGVRHVLEDVQDVLTAHRVTHHVVEDALDVQVNVSHHVMLVQDVLEDAIICALTLVRLHVMLPATILVKPKLSVLLN